MNKKMKITISTKENFKKSNTSIIGFTRSHLNAATKVS